ncbi:ABC transporter ATP-binding protein [Saccharibacillus alkalitolerans]|uniref:ABC transporter ATP-binding protein n=1 Tax=Saccharibacillus alkalitolerans TaxID=2705290 RepID=A0ABX0F6U1_9BACL|nr:ABC transporter ATP-binding protein [Saccharibacillus alkalitolerans]NGZ75645.1 ABC transporter ATP-binding protein [Saccharibacillus alkalitolerans]
MIEIRNLVKRYFADTPNEITVLKGIDLSISEGEFVAIVGQSGSGKSTLMNIIGALDQPSSGEYELGGTPIQRMNRDQLAHIRNQKIGFVFQSFNLIPRSSALKNVELPMVYAGIKPSERTRRAKSLLEMMGMSERMNHQPNELSGGQKQRVAIARALANDPDLILADEPTGALDSKTGNLVMEIFLRIHREEKKTILFITHSAELAELCPRVVTVKDGEIVSDKAGSNMGGMIHD